MSRLMAESTGDDMQRYRYNGKELDRMHGLDWHDYGARWNNNILGLWTTVDPLCEKYPDVNPYLYCEGNPIKYLDSDGQKIVDSKGHRMVYYDNNRQIHYTKYADCDVRTLVKCLSLTDTGTSMLKQLVNSDISVRFSILQNSKIENNCYTYAETTQGNFNKSDNYGKTDDGKGIREATIKIYQGSIDESIKDGSHLKHEGLTQQQALGAVIGHEIVHATNKNEIATDIKYELQGKINPDREKLPNDVENKIIEEYKKK